MDTFPQFLLWPRGHVLCLAKVGLRGGANGRGTAVFHRALCKGVAAEERDTLTAVE